MLVWPWIFLTIVWARRGVQMHNQVAKAAIDHPQITSFFATLLGNIASMIVSVLFSIAVVRFAQEWVTKKDHITVFDVSLISAFRNQSWPWSMKDHKYLLARNRWLPVVLAGACIAASALMPPGMTSLISPVSFYRTSPLMGIELDFSSNATDCIHWFAGKMISTSTCDWFKVSSLPQTGCITDWHMSLLDCKRSAILRLSCAISHG
jgi:hypothetical protein